MCCFHSWDENFDYSNDWSNFGNVTVSSSKLWLNLMPLFVVIPVWTHFFPTIYFLICFGNLRYDPIKYFQRRSCRKTLRIYLEKFIIGKLQHKEACPVFRKTLKVAIIYRYNFIPGHVSKTRFSYSLVFSQRKIFAH